MRLSDLGGSEGRGWQDRVDSGMLREKRLFGHKKSSSEFVDGDQGSSLFFHFLLIHWMKGKFLALVPAVWPRRYTAAANFDHTPQAPRSTQLT